MPSTSGWYRLSLLCGAGPLLAGLSIFGAWTLTRWDGLMLAGAATVAAGVLVFCIGLYSLSRFSKRARLEAAIPLKRISFQVALATGLLFSNLPVACTI